MKHESDTDNIPLEPPNMSHFAQSKAQTFTGAKRVLCDPQLLPLRPYSSTLPLPHSAPDSGLAALPPACKGRPCLWPGTSPGVFLGSFQHSDSEIILTLIWHQNHLERSRIKVTACQQSGTRLSTIGGTFTTVCVWSTPCPGPRLSVSPSSPDHLRHKEKRSTGGGVCLYPDLTGCAPKGLISVVPQ